MWEVSFLACEIDMVEGCLNDFDLNGLGRRVIGTRSDYRCVDNSCVKTVVVSVVL